jgi:hypothetical protein
MESKSMAAKSSEDMFPATARSGLPTSLRKTVSPVKIQNSLPF